MSKTWYGHHIETIKGDDYVLFKDYLELDKEIERTKNIIDELEKFLKEESSFNEYKDVLYRETMGYVLEKLKELEGEK